LAGGAGVHAKNTISVAMEDLTEDVRREIEWELKEEMASSRKQTR
jgi:hypothetical protein